jgi:hypothetical protein
VKLPRLSCNSAHAALGMRLQERATHGDRRYENRTY